MKKQKRKKTISKYFSCYLIAFSFFFFLLFLAALIPKSALMENMQESADFYKTVIGIHPINEMKMQSYIHYSSDSGKFNIMYHLNEETPLKAIMKDSFYQIGHLDYNLPFVESVEQNTKANTQYLRYWHGSIAILRPLLLFFNAKQMYSINRVLLYVLSILLFFMLWKKEKKLSLLYLLSMLSVSFFYVPYCFEYSWVYYIAIISSIIALYFENKRKNAIYYILLLNGLCTCFFDYLSTELIALLMPLLFIFWIRYQKKEFKTWKEGAQFLIKGTVLWGSAYIVTWLLKWILASIILKENAFKYVTDQAFLRVGGVQTFKDRATMYEQAFTRNFYTLFSTTGYKGKNILLVFLFLLCPLILISFTKKEKRGYSYLLYLLFLIPYLRYLILANHSARHFFFTFRLQQISILCIFLIVIQCLPKKIDQKS